MAAAYLKNYPPADRVPLHPSIRATLDAAPPSRPYAEIPVAELRETVNARIRSAPKRNESVAGIHDRKIDGPAGPLPVRIYTPEGRGPFPIVVLFHGGGWVCGNLDTHDDLCRSISHHGACLVVSVDYRLSPEYKFPAPLNDCNAALAWTAEHAAEIGGDPARLAVAGDSAGGNLAAGVALMARDRGGPKLALQVLLYPIANHNLETASYHQNANGYGLTRETMRYYWRCYLNGTEDSVDPYASPLLAAKLEGAAPALIITAEYDPLRDDGLAYAARLAAAGVPVRGTNYLDMNHGFFVFGAEYASTRQALDEIGAELRSAW